MKAINLVLVLLMFFCFTRCNKETTNEKQAVINTRYIHELAVKAISGDVKSNKKLSSLIDASYPVNTNYNKLIVDSINTKGQTFFYVILEYPNPAYNRFAVYDKGLNLYLLDKSLNGDINFGKLEIDGLLFGRIVENFLSKDVIVNRLSLYKFNGGTVSLAFRSFTYYNSPSSLLSQEIKSFLKDTIITAILLPEKVKDIARSDTFVYKPSRGMYLSKNNTFSTLVIDKINNDKKNSGLPEITDEKSLQSFLGIQSNSK